MRYLLWLVAVGLVCAQGPGPAGGAGKGKAKGPAASPASRPLPPTVTPQTYTAAQIKSGEGKFTGQCGFCHGRDAAGGEGGPDLTRSEVIATDVRGDKIGPLLKGAAPHSFNFNATDVTAIAAFVHTQKKKFEAVGGGRRDVEAADLLTGNAQAGLKYFDTQCARCHSSTGDLKGIGTRFQGLALLQRMLNPNSGRPAPARPKVTITLMAGPTVSGTVAAEDEFSITVVDARGVRETWLKSGLKYTVDDPVGAHFEQLGKYTDKDMHDVYAYLVTLK